MDFTCYEELGAVHGRWRVIPRILGDVHLPSQHELWFCRGPGQAIIRSARQRHVPDGGHRTRPYGLRGMSDMRRLQCLY